MTTLIIYPLICAALYYLFSRATITAWLQDRYPDALASFLACPACSGFWYGGLLAMVGGWQEMAFLSMEPRSPLTVATVALCSVVWTPLVAALHIRALFYLQGSQTDGDEA